MRWVVKLIAFGKFPRFRNGVNSVKHRGLA
jgi:hypothetical protein